MRSDQNADAAGRLYDEADVQASWQSTIAVDYHQDIVISGGLRFTPYHAGHVLGASMFLIEIAGLKILYTGDYSREEDRHLVIAEIPPVKPDVMICESTFGVHTLPDRKDKEEQFTSEYQSSRVYLRVSQPGLSLPQRSCPTLSKEAADVSCQYRLSATVRNSPSSSTSFGTSIPNSNPCPSTLRLVYFNEACECTRPMCTP